MNPNRKIRIESFIKREIALTLNQEVRDPRLGFITVTRCELDDENQGLRCYYTVFGDDKQRHLTSKCLKDLRGFVQRRYAKSLKMRYVPELIFVQDELEVKRQHMDDLIRQARSTDPHPPPPDEE